MSAPAVRPSRPAHLVQPAFERFGDRAAPPLIITCEHASNRVPAPLRTSESDRVWLGSHWGYDIGARTVSRELVRRLDAVSVLARFSRLVCDANRPEDHVDLIRDRVEGQSLRFNRKLDEAERERRLATYHRPYHQAIDGVVGGAVAAGADPLLLSMHSFTPVWNHRVRSMDIGLLYTDRKDLAQRLDRQLVGLGWHTAHNLPYSARDGLAYAVERHSLNHALGFIEIEVNQTLICTPGRARRFAAGFAKALAALDLG